MSYETDRSFLGTEFAANWAGTALVHYPNQEIEPPDPTGSTITPAAWVSFDIDYDRPQEQITFSGTEQRSGQIRHGIFQEMDTGDAVALGLVDDLRAVWEAATISGFNIFPRDCWLEPPLSDGTWVARVLNVPFFRFIEDTDPVTSQATGTRTVTQAAHGLSSLDAVYKSGANYVAAQADTASTLARGIVTRVWSSSQFDVTFWGAITVTAHGVGSAGADFFLSQATPGLLTTTEPTTGWSQILGYVEDANNLIITIGGGVFT